MPAQTWSMVPRVTRRYCKVPQASSSLPAAKPPQATASSVPNAEDYHFEWDLSAVHAFRARKVFIESIRHGEAGARLAQAAVATAAEDDAVELAPTNPARDEAHWSSRCKFRGSRYRSNTQVLLRYAATHSTVPFPQKAYLARIDKLAAECQALVCARLPDNCSPSETAAAIQHFLEHTKSFKVSSSGRSNLPEDSVVDHPGVWEEPKDAYINELLIRKCGHASVVAVLVNEVFRKLFEAKAIDFLVTLNCGSFDRFPVPVPLALPRPALLLPDTTESATTGAQNEEPVNTCSVDTLHEMLSHQKRAFWPFAWDTGRQYSVVTRTLPVGDAPESSGDAEQPLQEPSSHTLGSFGGFLAAASEAVHGPANSYIQVISRAAKNRLQRGIWTSPGAGDIRRAVAACERLVLLTSSCRFSFAGAEEDEQGPDVCGQLEAFERRDLGALYLHGGMLAAAKVELQAFQRCRDCYRDAMQVRKDEDEMLRYALEFLNDVDVSGLVPLTAESWLQQKEPSLDELDKRPLSW